MKIVRSLSHLCCFPAEFDRAHLECPPNTSLTPCASWGRPCGATCPLKAHCCRPCPQTPASPRNGSLQHFHRQVLTLNRTACKLTIYSKHSKCSNGAATGHYAGLLGFTLHPTITPCRPQQLWGFQLPAYWCPESLSHPSRTYHPISLFTSLLVSPNECEELTSSALRTLGWCPAQAGTAHTVSIPPSELTAPASAPNFPHSYHETDLCSSLTDLLSIRTRMQANSRDGKLQNALAG